MTPPEPTDPRSDQDLVAAVNRGETGAFEVLYRRHRDWVVRLAYRCTADRDDALDVLQETFAYLLRRFPGFRLTAAMTTFLYPVVKHVSISLLRKRGREVSDDALIQAVADEPGDDAGARRAELAAMMASLPPAQREVVLMRFVDGMSLAEIAAALGIPAGTVKSRLHHALAALRNDPRTRAYFEE